MMATDPTLVLHPDPILRVKGQPVTNFKEWKTLTPVLFEKMKEWKGCGLAAPQVSLSYQMFLLNITRPIVFFNPEILEVNDRLWTAEEGCLSIPDVKVNITRPRRIKVRWTNLDEKQEVAQFEGWTARAWLHEHDHLQGKLIIDFVDEGEKD